jgi:hypothetical protein
MLASCKIQNGLPACFWTDSWDLGVSIWKYPDLYAYAHKNIIVRSFLQGDIEILLWLPLSMVASRQLTELNAALDDFHLSIEERDS